MRLFDWDTPPIPDTHKAPQRRFVLNDVVVVVDIGVYQRGDIFCTQGLLGLVNIFMVSRPSRLVPWREYSDAV